jgi:hypothetical protein
MLTSLLADSGRLGAQQLLIELADLFQRRFQGVIVFQTLLHMRCLLFTQTDLVHATTWITDGENGNGMPAPAVAPLAAPGTVTDLALKQGAAQDIAGFGKLRQQPVPFADDLLLRH